MGLEAATYIEDLNTANPAVGDPRSQGDDHLRLIKAAVKATFPGMAGRAWRAQTKSSGYTVLATDNMSLLNCTAALTLALTAAATLGNGHKLLVHANGGDVVVDPSGAELVNGAATVTVPDGMFALILCNGVGYVAVVMSLIGGLAVFGGAVRYTGVISPTQLTGNQNDYAPTSFSTCAAMRISADARRNVTGLAGGTAGRRVKVYNVGTFPIPFKYEDAASTAANRFTFACTLGGGQTMEIEYDATSSRWRALALPEPLGTTKDFAGSTMEEGFLAVDQNYSRTTYASLYNIVGTTWGVGDGSTTFGLFLGAGRTLKAAGTGADTETCTASSGNGFTVVSNNRKWLTGKSVVLSSLSGFTTSGSAGPTYYIVRISATNVRLATTLALAQNGAPDITISGSGSVLLTHTFEARTHGELGGEQSHAESSTEHLSHLHGQGFIGDVAVGAGGSATGQGGGADNTAAFGGNAAANIEDPFAVITRGVRYC